DRQIGTTTGWLGYGYESTGFFPSLAMNTAGYPAEQGYDGDHQYRQYGPITGLTPDGLIQFPYSTFTSIPGQSGSPPWVYDPNNGQRTVYGLIASGDDANQIGFGVRFTQGIIGDLQSWISQDPTPTGFTGLQTASAYVPADTASGPGTSTPGNVVNDTS